MEGLLVGLALGALAAAGVLAYRFGHDSRDGPESEEYRRRQAWLAGSGGETAGAGVSGELAGCGGRRHRHVYEPYQMEIYARQRQEDLLREAARARLLDGARRGGPARIRLAARWTRFRLGMAHWLGTRLVALGRRLQAQ